MALLTSFPVWGPLSVLLLLHLMARPLLPAWLLSSIWRPCHRIVLFVQCSCVEKIVAWSLVVSPETCRPTPFRWSSQVHEYQSGTKTHEEKKQWASDPLGELGSFTIGRSPISKVAAGEATSIPCTSSRRQTVAIRFVGFSPRPDLSLFVYRSGRLCLTACVAVGAAPGIGESLTFLSVLHTQTHATTGPCS